MSVGQELLNIPFSEMVYELASSIAKAQANLDMESIRILKIMGDKKVAPVYLPTVKISDNSSSENFVEEEEILTSMIGAGFQPTFYQFAETIIEVKMAISSKSEYVEEGTKKGTNVSWLSSSAGRNRKTSLSVTSIDATYTNKYNYSQEGSSLLRTRLVPVPPNSIIQNQIELRSQAMQMEYECKLKKIEQDIAKKQQEIEEKANTED